MLGFPARLEFRWTGMQPNPLGGSQNWIEDLDPDGLQSRISVLPAWAILSSIEDDYFSSLLWDVQAIDFLNLERTEYR